MAKDVIDDRFIGSLHLMALSREGLAHDEEEERTVIQTSTINALLEGAYEGDVTLGELLQHGTDGIGTIQGLDGELIVLHGRAYTARADGSVVELGPETKTPFAVLTRFESGLQSEVEGLAYDEFLATLDARHADVPVLAIRAAGVFTGLHLRSVEKQTPPYKPLRDVVADQTEWHLTQERGFLIGFRFPDSVAGVEVPGWHLHFLSEDRTHGGHVVSIDVESAELEFCRCHDLHVELPPQVALGSVGEADRGAINAVEGR